jgi:phage baseplate assembly protein W
MAGPIIGHLPPAIDPPPTPLPTPWRGDVFPGYGQTSDLIENWRVKFFDADGIPLNMVSFEVIDFGAIAYKEIFQCVKTILATPIMSAALERLLGVDDSIVDLPIDRAAEATVAILDALYFWEPRVEVIDISFDGDVINGHLICNLQLKIKNVIYGTDQPYDRNSVFQTPTVVQQMPTPTPPPQPPSTGDGSDNVILITGPQGPAGPEGPAGATGAKGSRGSLWFTGPSDPSSIVANVQAQDMYLNTTTAAIFQFDGTQWRAVFNGMDT